MNENKPDHVTEKALAVFYEMTPKALATRRQRGQIPAGVWFKAGRHIYYSLKGYAAWLESLRECQQASKSSAAQSASGSRATAGDAAKPSLTRRPRKGSQPQPVYALR